LAKFSGSRCAYGVVVVVDDHKRIFGVIAV
jgi:hypothetical protein